MYYNNSHPSRIPANEIVENGNYPSFPFEDPGTTVSYKARRKSKKKVNVQLVGVIDEQINQMSHARKGEEELLMFSDAADTSVISGWSKKELLQKTKQKNNRKKKLGFFSNSPTRNLPTIASGNSITSGNSYSRKRFQSLVRPITDNRNTPKRNTPKRNTPKRNTPKRNTPIRNTPSTPLTTLSPKLPLKSPPSISTPSPFRILPTKKKATKPNAKKPTSQRFQSRPPSFSNHSISSTTPPRTVSDNDNNNISSIFRNRQNNAFYPNSNAQVSSTMHSKEHDRESQNSFHNMPTSPTFRRNNNNIQQNKLRQNSKPTNTSKGLRQPRRPSMNLNNLLFSTEQMNLDEAGAPTDYLEFDLDENEKANHGKRLMDNEMISLANILRPSPSSVNQEVSLDHDDKTLEEEEEGDVFSPELVTFRNKKISTHKRQISQKEKNEEPLTWNTMKPQSSEVNTNQLRISRHETTTKQNKKIIRNDIFNDQDSEFLKVQNSDSFSFTSHGFSHVSDPRTWQKNKSRDANHMNDETTSNDTIFKRISKSKSKINREKEKPFYDSSHFSNDLDEYSPRTRHQRLSHKSYPGDEGKNNIRLRERVKSPLHNSIESNISLNDSKDTVFMKIVGAVVIQTYVRRYLAFKSAWKRYSAIFRIQSFFRAMLQNKIEKKKQVLESKPAKKDVNVAATQIQSVFRGWWVRDCLVVDSFCCTLIQRNVRRYLCYLNFQYDLYCITVVQSIARRYLVSLRKRKIGLTRDIAATKIQALWRMYDANMNFIHALADILIIQSIARRWIAMRLIRPHQRSKRLGATNNILMNDFREEPYNRLFLNEKKTLHESQVNLKHSKNLAKRQIPINEMYFNPKNSLSQSHPRRVRISRYQTKSKSYRKERK